MESFLCGICYPLVVLKLLHMHLYLKANNISIKSNHIVKRISNPQLQLVRNFSVHLGSTCNGRTVKGGRLFFAKNFYHLIYMNCSTWQQTKDDCKKWGLCTSKAALISGSPLGSTKEDWMTFAFSRFFTEALLLLSVPSFSIVSASFGLGIQQRIKPRAKALHNINKITALL